MAIDSDEDARLHKYFASLSDERQRNLRDHGAQIEEYCAFSESEGIVLEKSDFDYALHLGIFARKDQLAHQLLANIQRDKDGLYRLADLRKEFSFSGAGCLLGSRCILWAHPHFRRRLDPDSAFAPHFAAKFWEMSDRFPSASIALDDDRIRIDLDHLHIAERDTWYGAAFSEEIQNISLSPVKLTPPLDLTDSALDFWFGGAYALNVQWTQKGAIKTFQAIEFKNERVTTEVNGETVFPARYVHAEYDLDGHHFRHFDGAMQYFNAQEYFVRRDSDFNHNDKSLSQIKARSKKLFKFNDHLTVEDVTDFCSYFWTGNPLAIEYFSGKLQTHVTEAILKYRARKGN